MTKQVSLEELLESKLGVSTQQGAGIIGLIDENSSDELKMMAVAAELAMGGTWNTGDEKFVIRGIQGQDNKGLKDSLIKWIIGYYENKGYSFKRIGQPNGPNRISLIFKKSLGKDFFVGADIESGDKPKTRNLRVTAEECWY